MKNNGSFALCKAHLLRVLGVSIALQTSGFCYAQTSNLMYEKLVAPPAMDVNNIPIGAGEQIDLQTGRLTLRTTDIAIPGNDGISVEIRRFKDTGAVGYGLALAPLGDWVLDLPRISVTHAKNIGWATQDASRPYKNCSISQRSYINPASGTKFPENQFYTFTYWAPPTLHLPGGGGGALLYNDAGLLVPINQGQIYWRTLDQAIVSCLPNVANPTSGLANNAGYDATEGYLVTTADGLKYRFDWVATDSSREVRSAFVPTGSGYPSGTVLTATMYVQNVSLYPTRIEDRFGNFVNYQYSNAASGTVKLNAIVASDGRSISLGYDSNGFLTSASSGDRKWSYSYEGAGSLYKNLVSVQNPDASRWAYTGGSTFTSSPTMDPYYGSCVNQNSWMKEQTTDTVDIKDYSYVQYVVGAPSGLQTTYRFTQHIFGKSAVPKNCYVSGWISSPFLGMVQEPTLPVWYAATTLAYKAVTGPGIADAVWRYGYISRHGFLPLTDGYTRTRVLDPDGSLQTYMYGNIYNQNEGLLQSVVQTRDGAELSRTNFTYELGGTNSAYPKRVGAYPSPLDAGFSASYMRPMIGRVTTQSGVTYTWRVAQDCDGSTCLDSLGRPTKIIKSSAGN